MTDVRRALAAGDLEEARARLSDSGRGTDDLLFALEDGLLLHYLGDYAASNERLAFADERIDDLYTKSLTRGALSLLASDLVLRFEPDGVEPFLIHYYRALNHYALGDLEGARVEWRRLAYELQFAAEHGDAPYREPSFFNHLVGLTLEDREPEMAYVALRRAEAAYRRDGTPPGDLLADLIRLAGRLGLTDHLAEYRDRYGIETSGPAHAGGSYPPGHASIAAPAADPEGETAGGTTVVNGSGDGRATGAEIVVLVEEGFVAPIEEVRAFLPITRARARDLRKGDRARAALARQLAEEYSAGRYAAVRRGHARRPAIEYVLPVAFPVPGSGQPALRSLEVRAHGAAGPPGRPALDVSALQRRSLEDRLPRIYAKTILRSLIKLVAARKLADEAEEEAGEGAGEAAGVLANLAHIVTERADTRAWLGLPHRIWMVRLPVEPGVYRLEAVFDGTDVAALPEIEVGPGERRLISRRVF